MTLTMYASWNIRMKWESYVWFLRYGEQQTELSVTLDHFLPFYPPPLPPNNPKSKHILRNWKKTNKKKKHLEILSFYKSEPYMTIIWCMVSEIWSETDRFFVVLDHFLSFYPLKICKIKILKKWTKSLELLSFYKCVPQMTIIWCMVLEIWNATDRIFCLFGTFFALSFP